MFFGGDPFEHFAHGGGGGGRGRRGPAGDVDTTKLYETLGVSLFCLFCMGIAHRSICLLCTPLFCLNEFKYHSLHPMNLISVHFPIMAFFLFFLGRKVR